MQAFQTLFRLEMKDSDLTINEAISFIKDDNPDLDFEFIHWLVSGVKDHDALDVLVLLKIGLLHVY